MRHRTRLSFALLAGLASAATSPSFAADPGAATGPSRQDREKLAAVHDEVAECLRSERPFEDCRLVMTTACHERMGEAGCPMMEGSGMHHHGPMHGGPGSPETKGTSAPAKPNP